MKRFVLLLAALVVAFPVYAEEFNVDGYQVSIHGSQNYDNKFNLTGRIGRGPKCYDMQIISHLKGQRGDRVNLSSRVKNLTPSTSRIIDQYAPIDYPAQRWTVYKVDLHCLSR